MSHLTDEQFEDILQGRAEAPKHVDECSECRDRLGEKRALAHRVNQAFSSIHAGAGLADRIRAQIAAAGQSTAGTKAGSRVLPLRARRHIWSGLAIAAAILIVAIPRSLQINTSSGVKAAQTALAGIHRINLDSLEQLMEEESSGKQCQCLAGRTDGGMAMPCCKRGLCMCGCRMRDFQGRVVPSCVIEEPNTPPISVVLVPESPEALGMTLGTSKTVTGQAIWHATCGACNMASVRAGASSCCVMGDVPTENLVALLNAFEQ
jgi:anti-sigma factor RsiW